MKVLGFSYIKNRGDHRIYEDDKHHHVEVDMGEKDFRVPGMKILIHNSGVSRERFYGATKQTAKKIIIKKEKKKPKRNTNQKRNSS